MFSFREVGPCPVDRHWQAGVDDNERCEAPQSGLVGMPEAVCGQASASPPLSPPQCGEMDPLHQGGNIGLNAQKPQTPRRECGGTAGSDGEGESCFSSHLRGCWVGDKSADHLHIARVNY